jgi:hypothetical protein
MSSIDPADRRSTPGVKRDVFIGAKIPADDHARLLAFQERSGFPTLADALRAALALGLRRMNGRKQEMRQETEPA